MASSPQWSALPTRTLTNWIRLNTKRKIKQRYSPMFWQPFWISNLKLTFAPGYLTFNSKINKENLNNNINNVILPWSYNNPILRGILPKFATELNFKTNFENMFISIIWAEQNESVHCKNSSQHFQDHVTWSSQSAACSPLYANPCILMRYLDNHHTNILLWSSWQLPSC